MAADFNVLMLGARRTGKTSVLASMVSCFDEAAREIKDLKLTVEDETKNELDKKLEELKKIFSMDRQTKFRIDSEPSSGENTFDFKISLPGRGGKYTIRFTDFPGEFVNVNITRVRQLISDCPIILIAIDTPHLMEEGGAYHNAYNKVSYLDECLEHAIGFQKKQFPRLVVFIPLKCEKYYHDNRMDEVVQAVKNGYSHLFAFFQGENIRDFFTIAILPILTLGGVVFSEFGRNEYGNVFTFGKEAGIVDAYKPKYVYYKFKDEKACFSPEFCEQPMIYILTYIVVLARLKNNKKSKWRIVINILLFLFSPTVLIAVFFGKFLNRVWKDTDFQKGVDRLKDKVKHSAGCTIVHDPMSIFTNK